MHLLSVTLTNFKTHRDRNIEFQPGTNAICGENGAGKTSILEAIAWTLFNYQGGYTKDDLIRNGSGSAQVRVAFVSSRDHRTYEVERCTNRGYTLFDPQLNQRLPYTRIKDEVMPWLRQHLGVAPGTDLGQLFANTIGVPQGTFTADFLLSPDKRKPIFDTILKVEEYRTVYQQTNSLRKYAEAQVQRLQDQIAQYEERLQAWDDLQQRYQTVQTEIVANQQQLQQLETRLAQIQVQRTTLSAQAQALQQLQQQRQQLTTQLEAKQQAKSLLSQSLQRAQQAAAICQAQTQAHQQYRQAEQVLQQLEQQMQQRQALLKQQQTLQTQMQQRQADLTRLHLQREQAEQIEQAIQALADAIATQTQLEADQTRLRQQQQALSQLQIQRAALQTQLTSAQQEAQQTEAEIQRLQALSTTLAQIPAWEQQQQTLQQQISRIEAAQQFEAEFQQLVESGQQQQAVYRQQVEAALQALGQLPAPPAMVVQIRAALDQGQSLTQASLDALTAILQDISRQANLTQLQSELQTLQQTLNQAYGHQAAQLSLTSLQNKAMQLQQQQTTCTDQLRHLTQQLTQLDIIQPQLQHLEQQLTQLDNPRERHRLLQANLQTLQTDLAGYEGLQQNQAALAQQLSQLEAQLQAFDALDDAIAAQRQQQQTHQAGYLLYLQHQQAAQTLPQQEAEHQTLVTALHDLVQQQATIENQYQEQAARFDPEALSQLETTYTQLKSQADRLAGSLPQQRHLQQALESQIAALQTLATQREQAQQSLKQRERIKRFINFGRKVYKEAGPRITERYVHSISREADRLFRELLNRPNVALEWTRDYEIVVQEGPHSRRFINLSGGEQMCAALAVRLALLKTLADIDIAFFDEPTTNMDRPRRESLAEAIARLKSFQQLFVISHDDTFEKVTENVIVIDREP
jgi:exonuclease SbcC